MNGKDFLRISSRVDAGEQHKDAENSLQAANNHSPSRGARAGALGAGWVQREGQVMAALSPGAADPPAGTDPPAPG